MRVALLADNYPFASAVGGIGTYSRVLGRRLAEDGHDVHVFAFGTGGRRLDGRLLVHLLRPWARRRDMGLLPAVVFTRQRLRAQDLNAFQLARAVRAEARRGGPFDVLESPEFGGLGRFLVGERAVARTLAVRLHGPASAFARPGERPWSALREDPERSLALAADVVTAPTQAAVDLCRRVWQTDVDATVVGNPVEPCPAPAAGRHGADVLFVGRLEHRKGLDVLVGALELLGRPLAVRLAGEDAELQPGRLATQVLRERGLAFEHLGVISPSEVRAEMSSARVVVLPSRAETFGLTLVEAMTCGAPTVASDIPPFREIAGGGALLLPLDDRAAWAGAIETLLQDDDAAAALGRAGRERARQFGADLVARRMLDAWRRPAVRPARR